MFVNSDRKITISCCVSYFIIIFYKDTTHYVYDFTTEFSTSFSKNLELYCTSTEINKLLSHTAKRVFFYHFNPDTHNAGELLQLCQR